MNIQFIHKTNLILAFALLSLLPAAALAQTNNALPRITQAVDATKLTVLRGNTHPLARAEFDRGSAPANLPMEHMLLVLQRSPEQETALEKLMAGQQDKSSPNYHQWLTPDQFGAQFGPADQDVQSITSWLQSQGFQVNEVTKGRTVIDFSGNASQVQAAFHTAIHQYVLANGEQHWANSSDPSIPTALTPVVAGIGSLHNFPKKPMSHIVGGIGPARTGAASQVGAQFTFAGGCYGTGTNCYGLGPYDFATIYNVIPLWNAGIDGTGETIAAVSDSDINISDVNQFRSLFGLPAIKFQQIETNPNTDPGVSGPNGDELEAVLDVEWSGSVAKNATIDLVVSRSTNATFGGDISATFIVDNYLAPILSYSYGECELGLGTAENSFYNTEWQQAAAEGITVIVSSGDNGSAGCDVGQVSGPPSQPAEFGLQVNGVASTPYDVAVGGTDFNYPNLNNPSAYWSASNTTSGSSSTLSSLGYIPEMTWNDSCTSVAIYEGLINVYGLPNNGSAATACNNATVKSDEFVLPVGGSGGFSNCTASNGSTPSSCSGGYAKPSWQTGVGVPADGKRDLPDISLFAGDGTISGSFYIDCEADLIKGAPSCNLSNFDFNGFGGTSVSTQVFAGMMALVVQKTSSWQGNANPVLYSLSAQQSPTNCNSSAPGAACVFNDVTVGTIAMPCQTGTLNCTVVGSNSVGVLTGYNAGAGYDQATGLGTVNAANLVNASSAWATTVGGDFTLSASPSPLSISTPGGTGVITLTVQGINGYAGTINFSANSCSGLPSGATCSFSPGTIVGSGSSTLTITTTAASTISPMRQMNHLPFSLHGPMVPLLAGLCIGISLLGFGLRSEKVRARMTFAGLVFAFLVTAGCGGGSSSSGGGGVGGTPVGTTTVVITAATTSGTILHRSVVVSVNVN